MQFGSSNTAVFFKMRVAGVLHIFQFETKQVLAPLQISSLLINHLRVYFYASSLIRFYLDVFLLSIQGEEICVALQTHINDVMLRRYSKARSATSGSTNGDLSNNFKPSDVEMYEKRVQDLSKAVEESQRNADQVRK